MLPWRRAVRDFALFFDEVKKIPQDTRSDSIRSMVHLDYARGTQKYRQPPNAVQKTRFLPREFLFLAAALFLIPIP